MINNVIVTGGCGFIGSHLVHRLADVGFHVTVVDDLRNGKTVFHSPSVQYYFEDVSTFDIRTKNIEKPVAIFHLANTPRVRRSLEFPSETINNNISTTTMVAEWAAYYDTILFFASSSSTKYKDSENPYTWSKKACHEILDLYHKLYGLTYTTLFFYNVYGPREADYGEHSTVIRKFKKDYLEGNPLTVFGTGKKERDFTHVDDVIQGILQLMVDEEALKLPEIHFGSGDPKTIKSIAEAFKTNIVYAFDRPGEAKRTFCETPYINSTNDVFKYIEGWLKENPSGTNN